MNTSMGHFDTDHWDTCMAKEGRKLIVRAIIGALLLVAIFAGIAVLQ